VELGHVFKLGTKYSAALGANFLDAQGKLNPIVMGCYGIGVSRMISAVIEQNRDENGIIWPKEVAPYKVIILPLDTADSKIMEAATEVYRELKDKGIEPLLDDRDERAGVKFKDADLLGIPLGVVIGKESMKNGCLELKIRASKEKTVKPAQEIISEIERFIHG